MVRHEITVWDTQRKKKQEKMQAISRIADGKVIKEEDMKTLLKMAIHPGDKVAVEGDNQKQAEQLSKALTTVDPKIVHDLHMIISTPQLDEHLDIFELGIAKVLDFAF